VSERISRCFTDLKEAGRTALIPFVTVGDPHPDWTVDIMHGLVAGGANLIELGVPFSDPMADGPVIQQASERAIERGVSMTHVLETVREFRQSDQTTPVILMGYMNPIERFGAAALSKAASGSGVDGFLLVDCPPEESGPLQSALSSEAIDSIRLVAPTTRPERLKMICAAAQGFIYYVSFKGITGASRLDASALETPIETIRAASSLPVVAGFGINDAASAKAVAHFADGVVIGSALVAQLAEQDSRESAVACARQFVASVRESLDNG
jgi:tryptophan synthase alpha chain